MTPFTVICAVNDSAVLESSLQRSPDLKSGVQVILQRGYRDAGRAYNHALELATNEIVIFLHQDVYLPPGWIDALSSAMAQLAQHDPAWGVLGVYGVTMTGQPRGWTYSTGLGRMLGQSFSQPERVRTLDEMLLVIRRTSGLEFDELLPGFHMYGTDICLQAERRGLTNYAIPAFAVHNSNGIHRLPWAFWRACLHVQHAHRDVLPVISVCATIPRSRAKLLARAFVVTLRSSLRSVPVGRRVGDPVQLHRALVTTWL